MRKKGEKISFEEVNLYENHLDNTFIDIALRGKQYTVEPEKLAKDLSTKGCFPKAWKRVENGFVLLKDGGKEKSAGSSRRSCSENWTESKE